jgi:hypothetical protein
MTWTNVSYKQASGALAGLGLVLVSACAGTEAIAAGTMGDAFAAAAGIPQMDAFLPYAEDVPETEALSIDGDWKISTLGKTIRIDSGRAYALDPWTHAMTLKVRRNMVVMRNIRKIDAETFSGDDLPLMGPATMTQLDDGRLSVTVQSFPPYKYFLIPVSSRAAPDPDADLGGDEDDEPIGDDDLGACELVELDPATDELYCAD